MMREIEAGAAKAEAESKTEVKVQEKTQEKGKEKGKGRAKVKGKAKVKTKAQKNKPSASEIQKLLTLESPGGLLAGVDEAGRGPLAGPVFAAAVILNPNRALPVGLTDSKKLSAKARERLYGEIMAQAVCVSVGSASVAEIDAINILQATMLAMTRAIQGLRLPAKRILIDGNRIPTGLSTPAYAVVQGDALIAAISAASIIAKVRRDQYCMDMEALYPGYGFAQHKGYGSAAHLTALRTLGPCPEHRRSFAPVREWDAEIVLAEHTQAAAALPPTDEG